MNEEEKRIIIETEIAFFVFSKSWAKSAITFAELRRFFTNKIWKIVQLLQFGTSYFAMIFKIDEKRETRIKSIRKKTFRVERNSINLIVINFDETTFRKNTVWQFSTNILNISKIVIKTVKSFVTEIDQTCPKFTFKRHFQDQIQLNIWSIQFKKKIAWIAKQLQINSSIRLMTEENSICLLCLNKSHGFWFCSKKKSVRLFEELTRHKRTISFSNVMKK